MHPARPRLTYLFALLALLGCAAPTSPSAQEPAPMGAEPEPPVEVTVPSAEPMVSPPAPTATSTAADELPKGREFGLLVPERFEGLAFGSRPDVDGVASTKSADDVRLVGELKRKVIRRLKYCYERVLKMNPDFSGKSTIEVTVDEHGQVTTSTVRASTFQNPGFESCTAKAYQGVKVAPPKNPPATVRIPHVFKVG